jgi:hypothetical protein
MKFKKGETGVRMETGARMEMRATSYELRMENTHEVSQGEQKSISS